MSQVVVFVLFFQLINELRLRLPLSERDEITSEAKKAAGLTEENYETKRALKVAQATVSSLQVCLLPAYYTEFLQNLGKLLLIAFISDILFTNLSSVIYCSPTCHP